MTTATFVTRTVLIKNTNTALYDYFDEFVCLYQFLFRKVYHNYKHNLNGQKESEYRSELMEQFNITNRMAKAIMLDVKTSINSLKALFDYQINRCKIKISKLSAKIMKLKRKLQAKKYGKFKTKINLQKHLFKCQVKLNGLCQVLVGKFPYLFLLSLFFYFFVSQISPGYALNRYFSLVAKYKIS